MSLLPDDRTGNLVVWSVVAACLLCWFALTVVSDRFPSLADVAGRVRRPPLGRWLLVTAWAWLGWHLFVRTST